MDNPFESIHQRLARIESLCDRLLANSQLVADNQTTSKRPVTIEEVAKLTHCVVSTVRGWVAKRLIPCHRQGKRLLFFENEILEWIKNGRRLTCDELAIEAEHVLARSRKKGGRNGNVS